MYEKPDFKFTVYEKRRVEIVLSTRDGTTGMRLLVPANASWLLLLAALALAVFWSCCNRVPGWSRAPEPWKGWN